jgi:LacI family transcriptional regulator, repressor for deo operon, udp, cdd, tsx, nupC, and nupG
MVQSTHPSGGRGRATIEDVAAAAGVSVATVSRAMRGLPNVALSTRERVLAIAGDLKYRPDPAAARLATGRSRSMALVVPLLNSWYFSQVVAGAEAVCAEAGYDVVVIGVASDVARRALLDDTTSIHRRVDGLVFVDIAVTADDEAILSERGLAVVSIGAATERFPSVGIDDVAVGRLATSHLLDLGHTRIGLIGGQPEEPLGFKVPGHRRTGYTAALRNRGLPIDPELQFGGNFSVMGGHDATLALLSLPDPPTAVFAMSDEMAFGALLAARTSGVSVPDDLSACGNLDVTPQYESVYTGADERPRPNEQALAKLAALPDRLLARRSACGDDDERDRLPTPRQIRRRRLHHHTPVTPTGKRTSTPRSQGGNPPDISIFPQPGKLADFARAGNVVALSDEVAPAVNENWPESWVQFGNVDGTQYGVPVKTDLKSLVWYQPAAFEAAGYEVPETFDEFTALVDEMAPPVAPSRCASASSPARPPAGPSPTGSRRWSCASTAPTSTTSG